MRHIPPLWLQAALRLPQVLQLLANNPYIVMDEHFEGNEDRTEEPEAGVDVKVWGNVVAFVERLDDEHFKSLQVSNVTCTNQGNAFSMACLY